MRRIAVLVVALAACSSRPGTKRDLTPERMFDAVKPVLEAQVGRTGALPVAHDVQLPASPCCDNPGHFCNPADYDGQRWIDRARLPGKIAYQLTYDSDGSTVSVHAMGDLDCDYVTTDTELTGQVQGKTVVWTVTKNAVGD
jgi:hypothetical protein